MSESFGIIEVFVDRSWFWFGNVDAICDMSRHCWVVFLVIITGMGWSLRFRLAVFRATLVPILR